MEKSLSRDATGDNFVFLARSNKQFTFVTANHMINRIKVKLLAQGHKWAEKLALHQFRRASITHASNEGRPIAHVCQDAWGKSYSTQIKRYNKPGQVISTHQIWKLPGYSIR